MKNASIMLCGLILCCASSTVFAQTAEDWYDKGKNATDFNQQIEYFTKAIQKEFAPLFVAYYMRGTAKYHVQQYQIAILDFDKAIELNPNFAAPYVNRGVSKKMLGRYQEAIQDFDQAIKLNPNHFLFYYYRGSTKFQLDQYATAITDLDKAIELNPADAESYLVRGSTKKYLKQHELAILDLNKAIELDPHNITAYDERGYLRSSLKEYQAAILDFSKAIELEPNAIRYNNRGWAKFNLGQYSLAILDYDKAINLNPNYEVCRSNRLLALSKLNAASEKPKSEPTYLQVKEQASVHNIIKEKVVSVNWNNIASNFANEYAKMTCPKTYNSVYFEGYSQEKGNKTKLGLTIKWRGIVCFVPDDFFLKGYLLCDNNGTNCNFYEEDRNENLTKAQNCDPSIIVASLVVAAGTIAIVNSLSSSSDKKTAPSSVEAKTKEELKEPEPPKKESWFSEMWNYQPTPEDRARWAARDKTENDKKQKEEAKAQTVKEPTKEEVERELSFRAWEVVKQGVEKQGCRDNTIFFIPLIPTKANECEIKFKDGTHGFLWEEKEKKQWWGSTGFHYQGPFTYEQALEWLWKYKHRK